MRIAKRRNLSISRLMPVAAIAVVVSVLASAGFRNGGLGERAALLSAAMNMPESGFALLRERFEQELYGDGVPNADTPPEYDGTPLQAKDNNKTAAEEEPETGVLPIPETTPSKAANPPKIPEKYAAAIVSENFAGREGGTLIRHGDGFIKNDTKLSDAKVLEILEEGYDLGLTDTDEPQVLLFHTHATESFERYDSDVYDVRNTWRSTDNNNNMAAVGSAMQQVLEENGVSVIHDTTQHDYPSYNGSYERSAKTIQEYLDEYPSIKIVLDLHRDAMEREDGTIVKPVAEIGGEKAAQIMIIAGCDDGTMNMPNWAKNLRFAADFADEMEQSYPDLCRPVYFCYRKYNMDRSDGSLLLEFGSNANTLDEALYSARLVGQVLADMINASIS